MYLRDYLNDIPLRHLRMIADRLGVKVEYRARIKLTNAIDHAFWEGGLTDRLVADLDDRQRLVLSIIAFSFRAGITERALVRRMERLTGMQRADIIATVTSLIPFALAGGISGSDDRRYFCPGGIGDRVREIMLEDVLYHPETAGGHIPAGPPDLVEDIFSFLAKVYKSPAPLTLGGRVKKVALDRIFEGSPVTEGPQALTWEFRNAFVIEYLKQRGLIEFSRREVIALPPAGGWLRLSMTDRYADLAAFAFRHLLHDHMTIVTMYGILGEMLAGTGIDVPGLADFLHGKTPATGGAVRLESRLAGLMRVFSHLGLFHARDGRYVMTAAGEQFFSGGRLPMDDAMSSCFMIQPNYEVIAGPELQPVIRMILELMSRRKNRDVVTTYTLAPEGVADARERGMSTADIVAFFERHSRTPLTQNIRFSLESWAEAYGRISFETVTLMRFRDAAACESVLHMPEIAPFIRERLSDTVVIVTAASVPGISASLKKNGFRPASFGKQTPDPVLEGGEYRFAGISTLLDEYNIPDIRHTFVFPEPEPSSDD